MDSGKRASMREGPLAQLFRRTDAPAPEPANEREGEKPEEHHAAGPRADGRVTGAPAPREDTIEQLRPAPPSARVREPEALHEETRERPRLTPEERLRNVFSADIPENMMERSSRPSHEQPAYGREEPRVASVPEPTREPVLRVVGVGGGGVNAVNRMVEAGVEGVEFIAVNTDLQSLQQTAAHETVHIGA